MVAKLTKKREYRRTDSINGKRNKRAVEVVDVAKEKNGESMGDGNEPRRSM
jgi:hypothetical protein